MDEKSEVGKVYNKIAKKYSETFDNDFSDKQYLDNFLSLLNKGDKILDIGCGSGRASGYFDKMGFEAIGVDISENMINISKKKYPHIKFIVGDMRNLGFEKNSFDGISFSWSLFHVNKKEVPEVLAGANSLLRVGGALFLVMQEGNGEVYINEPLMPSEKIYFNLYTRQEVIDLLEKSGFEVLYEGKLAPDGVEIPYNKLIFVARKSR